MKKFLILAFLVLVGCGGSGEPGDSPQVRGTVPYVPRVTLPNEVDELWFDLTIDLEAAAEFFARANWVWDADGGELWGAPLHAPLIVVDAVNRHAVANMRDERGALTRYGGVYVGILPAHVIVGATVSEFSGTLWGMTPWHILEQSGEDEFFATMLHEGFHVVQGQFKGGSERGIFSVLQPHTANLDARVTVILEIRALFDALSVQGSQRERFVHYALSARKHRRTLYPDAIASENNFELSEGLTVWTEVSLVLPDRDAQIEFIDDMQDRVLPAEYMLFGYITGALYAMLLSDAGADWQSGLTWQTDLGELLQQAFGIAELTPFGQLDLEIIGYSEIVAEQAGWIENFQRVRQGAFDTFRLGQPLLRLVGDGYFDEVNQDYFYAFFVTGINAPDESPQSLVYYGEFTFVASFGEVRFNGGYMRTVGRPAGASIDGITAVGMEIIEGENRAVGQGWELVLNAGYGIRELEDGDFETYRR